MRAWHASIPIWSVCEAPRELGYFRTHFGKLWDGRLQKSLFWMISIILEYFATKNPSRQWKLYAYNVRGRAHRSMAKNLKISNPYFTNSQSIFHLYSCMIESHTPSPLTQHDRHCSSVIILLADCKRNETPISTPAAVSSISQGGVFWEQSQGSEECFFDSWLVCIFSVRLSKG